MTDGAIAANNEKSTRVARWRTFQSSPDDLGAVQAAVDCERTALQFFGDRGALVRLSAVADHLTNAALPSWRADVIVAQIRSVEHRFPEAEMRLARAEVHGAPQAEVEPWRLSVFQATGRSLIQVVKSRRHAARESPTLDNLVALGALLADLGQWDAAAQTFTRAITGYSGTSPLPVAWAAFQCGRLWGEMHAQTDSTKAAHWYEFALNVLPSYVQARVHLAELYLVEERFDEAAELLLEPVAAGDPEALACFARVEQSRQNDESAAAHLRFARRGFEQLLARYEAAFADHAIAFYLGVGDDGDTALKLAYTNALNRPTFAALERARTIAAKMQDHKRMDELALLLARAEQDVREALNAF